MKTLSSISEDIDTGFRLKSIRLETKVSQKEFAKLLEVSRSAYITYEQGTREVPVSVVRFLASQFNLNPNWLILGTGAKHLRSDRSKINIDLLAHLDTKLCGWLTENEKSLPTEERARLLAVCYEHFAAEDSVDESALELVLKMVA